MDGSITEIKSDIKALGAKLDKSLDQSIAIRAISGRLEKEVDNLERRM